jgi:hypothetical protein
MSLGVKCCSNRMSEREIVVELPWDADCCPCVEELRTVVPLTVGFRDGAVHLVLERSEGVGTERVQAAGAA